MLIRGAFHLRCLSGNVAGKLGNAYLIYHNRQPAMYFEHIFIQHLYKNAL